MATKLIRRFLQLESASGMILFATALIAIVLANSPLAFIHTQFIDTFLFWINEGLMAVFFLLVGLELKRNYYEGQFSQFSQITLPLVAAVGGMIIPICLYVLINYHDANAIKGWATPAATDIAFALGVLSLFGRRVPVGLKLFLLSLAIFDDMGAILIIAIFFSGSISYAHLIQALILLYILYLFNRLAIHSLLAYVLVGIWLWIVLLHSGIHPTVAGVALALSMPVSSNATRSPLHRLEQILHPWVAYVIMPLFALANAGIYFGDLSVNSLFSGVVLGIVTGLFVGKQLGVFSFAYLWIRLGYSQLPDRSSFSMLYGVAILCGIGFTMSLFLGTLSFHNEDRFLAEVRLGVIIGSILSGVFGALVLWAFAHRESLQRSKQIIERTR